MRVAHIHGPDDVRVDDLPDPVPGDADVVLKVEACGVCGSDLGFARQGSRRQDGSPWPLGHEIAGTVVAAGAAASVGLGKRVVVNPMAMGGNIVGNGGSEGGFADLLLIRDAQIGRNLLSVPDGLPMTAAALVEPLSVALHAVHLAASQAGERVAVFGTGPIGLGVILWLKAHGIENICAIDLSDERLARARALGATVTINPRTQALGPALEDAHGVRKTVKGWSATNTAVFIDTAGGPTVVPDMIRLAKWKARLILVAVHERPVEIDLHMLLMKELRLTPSVGYPSEMPQVLDSLSSLPPEVIDAFVSDTFPFARFDDALACASKPHSGKVMVVFP